MASATSPTDIQQGTGGAGNRFNERMIEDFFSGEPINKPSTRGKPFVYKRKEDGKISMITYLMQPMGSGYKGGQELREKMHSP